MAGIILGAMLIIGGASWTAGVCLASGTTDRAVENSEIAFHVIGGLGAIALGIGLIVFG